MCDYSSCIPIRLCLLVLLNELPLHDLQATHFLLHIFQLIVQHKALLVQILQSCLPALVVDLLAVILAAAQDRCACLYWRNSYSYFRSKPLRFASGSFSHVR